MGAYDGDGQCVMCHKRPRPPIGDPALKEPDGGPGRLAGWTHDVFTGEDTRWCRCGTMWLARTLSDVGLVVEFATNCIERVHPNTANQRRGFVRMVIKKELPSNDNSPPAVALYNALMMDALSKVFDALPWMWVRWDQVQSGQEGPKVTS